MHILTENYVNNISGIQELTAAAALTKKSYQHYIQFKCTQCFGYIKVLIFKKILIIYYGDSVATQYFGFCVTLFTPPWQPHCCQH